MKVGELKEECKKLGLAISGTKANLEARLAAPDEHRVMVGKVSLKVTKHFTILMLHVIRDNYHRLGHPNKQNIDKWKDELGIIRGGGEMEYTEWDSLVYGKCQNLKGSMPPMSVASSATPPSTSGGKKRLASLDEERPAPPKKKKAGKFTPDEDEQYLRLLNEFGQPLKHANPKAWEAFHAAFHYRSEHSWPAHANAFQKTDGGGWVKT
mmetsp:Transcript_86/g.102  ORF Transcript_86/g.102 Transcript_86/m.102 type:complete len:209 (-) Transcript_86:300-926(-)